MTAKAASEGISLVFTGTSWAASFWEIANYHINAQKLQAFFFGGMHKRRKVNIHPLSIDKTWLPLYNSLHIKEYFSQEAFP